MNCLLIMQNSLIMKKISQALSNIVVGGLIVDSTNPVAAGFTAIVSVGGTISSTFYHKWW